MSKTDFQNGFALGLAIGIASAGNAEPPDLVGQLYEKFGVDREWNPYLLISCDGDVNTIYIADIVYFPEGGLVIETPYYRAMYHGKQHQGNFNALVAEILNEQGLEADITGDYGAVYDSSNYEYYANFDLVMSGTVYRI